MFFIVVVVHSFRRCLLEYLYLLDSVALRSLRGVAVMRVACAVRKDVHVVSLSVLLRMHRWL
jgi:hypothetical protein